ncbi:MAG: family 43 glycosylhydrolase [Bacteroidales bacterium]|nr:family 43 glycosylhydrolase [Bacteroidales bacterium]
MNRVGLSFLLMVAVSSAMLAQNPISPEGVYIADPSARVGKDGKMYIYGSLDVDPGQYCSDHYHVLSSKNLSDWTLHRNSFKSEMTLYAPDMMMKGKTYFLYYDDPQGREWVATSLRPAGPFKGGVQIDGPQGIDPNVFIDDDGQVYYFWGQFSAKGARMNPDMKTIDKNSMVDGIVTEKEHYFHEGGFVFKRGRYYYFTYADISRQGRPTCIGYSMSTSPLGPYEYKGVIVDNDGCDPAVWNNHGSVVEFNGQWYVLYHRSTSGSVSMRKACIEPIEFREDGTIKEVEMTSQGAAGPLDARALIQARRMCLTSGNARVCGEPGNPVHEIVSQAKDGDKIAFKYLDFGSTTPKKFTARVRGGNGGKIHLLLDQSFYGPRFSVEIPDVKGWQEVTCNIPPEAGLQGVHAIWLAFSVPGSGTLDLDWFRFE